MHNCALLIVFFDNTNWGKNGYLQNNVQNIRKITEMVKVKNMVIIQLFSEKKNYINFFPKRVDLDQNYCK